jgi:hypothetical protein
MPRLSFKKLLLLSLLLLASRMLFVLLMPAVHSYDLDSWLRVMDVLGRGENPYRVTEVLNWPPFWMQIIFGLKRISDHTGLDRIHLVQATLVFAELLILWGLAWIGRGFTDGRKLYRVLLWGLVLNPLCAFLSCQHCNYDVFVGLLVLIAIGFMMRYARARQADDWLMACFFVGMGILAKTIPVMLVPLLLAGWRDLRWRQRISGVLLLAAPFVIGMGVLYTLEPAGVKANVIGYRSMGGWYGISGLMTKFGSGSAMAVYKAVSPLLFLGVLGFTAISSFKNTPVPLRVLQGATLVLLFIPTFGPGYSPPYILWFLPLILLQAAIADRNLKRLLVFGLILVNLTYLVEYATLASHGAFLTKMISDPEFLEWQSHYGGHWDQTLLRIPMFAYYLTLFVALAKRLRQPGSIRLAPGETPSVPTA